MKNATSICHFTSVHVRYDVRIFHKQCQTLARAGYKVNLVVADGKGDEIKDNIRIHDVGKMPNRIMRFMFTPLIMFSKLLELKCTVYQFHDPELLPVGFLMKILTKSKIIYDAHECYADYFLHKDYIPKSLRPASSSLISLLENFAGKRMDQVIVTTEFHLESLRRLNERVNIIFNYPMLSEWNHLSDSDADKDNRNICYIGNITEERGLTQLIKAIESVDCTLHLAGNYEPPSYRNDLLKLPGWSKVKEYGYVGREKAANIISNSLIGVVLFLPRPIHYTSYSTKVFEYMAGGIATLVTDFPIWKSIVEANGCGVCINPTQIDLISQTLTGMLDNRETTIKMGDIGRRLTYDKFNWESQEPALLAIYSSLICE
jgi:glycosyltransferase involved in cell wall biosynthesis